jgi:hypothetical protein
MRTVVADLSQGGFSSYAGKEPGTGMLQSMPWGQAVDSSGRATRSPSPAVTIFGRAG